MILIGAVLILDGLHTRRPYKLRHLTFSAQNRELHISFHGLRYGHLDKKVELFDREKASYQLAHLKERLPLEVQDMIDQLHIISEGMVAEVIPSQFSHGFFDKAPTPRVSTDRESMTVTEGASLV